MMNKPKFQVGDVVESSLRFGRFIVVKSKYFADPPHWGHWLVDADGDPIGCFDEAFLVSPCQLKKGDRP